MNSINKTYMNRNIKKRNVVKNLVGTSAILLLLAGVLGCGENFPSFNEVDRFRILSVKAEPPSLVLGEIAEMSALLHVPDDEPVEYKWSWCPVAANPTDGRECIISEEQLNDMITEAIGAPESILDLLDEPLDFAERFVDEDDLRQFEEFIRGAAISYDLGSEPTANFINVLPPQVMQLICDALIGEDVPSFVGIPNCGEKIDVVIRLEATALGTTLYAVKKLPLYADEDRADNENPKINDVHLFRQKTDKKVDMSAGIGTLFRDETYRMRASVPEEDLESFVPAATEDNPDPESRRESMFLTWYVVGGDTEFGRTTFFDGEIPMTTLRRNEWYLPRKIDFPENDAWLYLVLHDERGGINWLSRRFTLKEAKR